MLPFVNKTILVRLRTFCFSDIIEKNIWKERERLSFQIVVQRFCSEQQVERLKKIKISDDTTRNLLNYRAIA